MDPQHPSAIETLRMRRAAAAIHAAGPRAVLGLIEDLVRAPDAQPAVLAACDRFARLRPDTLRRLGLAELPALPLHEVAR